MSALAKVNVMNETTVNGFLIKAHLPDPAVCAVMAALTGLDISCRYLADGISVWPETPAQADLALSVFDSLEVSAVERTLYVRRERQVELYVGLHCGEAQVWQSEVVYLEDGIAPTRHVLLAELLSQHPGYMDKEIAFVGILNDNPAEWHFIKSHHQYVTRRGEYIRVRELAQIGALRGRMIEYIEDGGKPKRCLVADADPKIFQTRHEGQLGYRVIHTCAEGSDSISAINLKMIEDGLRIRMLTKEEADDATLSYDESKPIIDLSDPRSWLRFELERRLLGRMMPKPEAESGADPTVVRAVCKVFSPDEVGRADLLESMGDWWASSRADVLAVGAHNSVNLSYFLKRDEIEQLFAEFKQRRSSGGAGDGRA